LPNANEGFSDGAGAGFLAVTELKCAGINARPGSRSLYSLV